MSFRNIVHSNMYRPLVFASLFALWFAVGHCDTLILQPPNYVGNTYVWLIPPQPQPLQPPMQQEPLHQASPGAAELQNQSPTPQPEGGCGHPPLKRLYSDEQLNLPNEFLIGPHGPKRTMSPVHQQQDPESVNCNGVTTTRPDEQHSQLIPATQHQSNQAPVQFIPAPWSPSAPSLANWPAGSSHGGGVGLLFFVPEAASHLPVEQLIRQQLGLVRTVLPFDISINCEDTKAGCYDASVAAPEATAATTLTAAAQHAGNVNYASLPLVKNVNSSGPPTRWRNIVEMLAQQHQQRQQQLHQQLLSMLPLPT